VTGRWPEPSPPFSAMGRAVRLDIGAVNRNAFGDDAAGDHGFENIDPQPAARPAVEAVVDRRWRAIRGRAILPPAAGLEDVNDPADHPPVVDAPRTWGWFCGKYGSIAAQASSSSQNRLLIPASMSLFDGKQSDLRIQRNTLIGFCA